MTIFLDDQPLLCPDDLPLQQSPGYAGALRLLGAGVRFAVAEDGAGPARQALVVTRRVAGLGLSLCSRGPIGQAEPLRALAAQAGALIVTPETGMPDFAMPETLVPSAGLRVAAPRSVAVLDLRPGAAGLRAGLDARWRNHLRRGEAADLMIRQSGDAAGLARLLAADRVQQRRRGYRNLPPAFVQAWAAANPGGFRHYSAWHRGTEVAAMLFLLHRPWVSYHIAWSDPAARPLEAHRRLLMCAMADLAEAGFTTLDLGQIAPGQNPGLAAFKLGTGAVARRLGASALILPPGRWWLSRSPAASPAEPHRAGGT